MNRTPTECLQRYQLDQEAAALLNAQGIAYIPSDWLTVEEYAHWRNVTQQTVYNWITKQRLPLIGLEAGPDGGWQYLIRKESRSFGAEDNKAAQERS